MGLFKCVCKGNVPKSPYSFWEVVTLPKRHKSLEKMGLNRFVWTDMFLVVNGYK